MKLLLYVCVDITIIITFDTKLPHEFYIVALMLRILTFLLIILAKKAGVDMRTTFDCIRAR